jgi:hypothetical protein
MTLNLFTLQHTVCQEFPDLAKGHNRLSPTAQMTINDIHVMISYCALQLSSSLSGASFITLVRISEAPIG